jgi:HEAT repeat protein
MRTLNRSIVFMACLLLAWSARLPAQQPPRIGAKPDLEVTFDANGLATLRHNGVELIAAGDRRFRLREVKFQDATAKDGIRQVYEPKPTTVAFDHARKVLTQSFDWGRVECAFAVKGERLDFDVKVTNTAPDPMVACNWQPVSLRLPHLPENIGENDRGGGPIVDLYRHDKGTIGLVNWNETRNYLLHRDKSNANARLLTVEFLRPEKQPRHPIVDEKLFFDPGRKILPGQSDSCRVSLAFGPPSASGPELCPDVYQAVAAARPMALDWPDRRPIATAFLCNSATGWPTNPRGFVFGKREKTDVTTEEGLQAFRESLLQYADNCIDRMKAMDAQGIIVWDIEGQEMPHMISYIGDPRLLAEVCPEMDRFSDEFMRKFTAAGLRTGITIRPTEVYKPTEPGQPRWNQREVRDPQAVMDEKIRVAKKRWGCTIFYLDSNVFGDGLLSAEQKNEMKGVPWTMPVAMIEGLQKGHPDCLIIPEWSAPSYYAVSAPYSSPNLGQLGIDPLTRRIWPTAFHAVALNRDLVERYWEEYLSRVQGGDVMLYPAWYDCAENEAVKMFYREADLRNRLQADGDEAPTLETLVADAKDSDECVRLRAATLLQKSSSPQAAAAIVSLLDDKSPIVQRQALRSIAASDAPQAKETTLRLANWISTRKNSALQNAFRPFAADALAKAGEPALPVVLELLAGKDDNAWPYALRSLGGIGVSNERVFGALQPFLDAAKDDPRARHRLAAVEVAGKVRCREAVQPLLRLLATPGRDAEELRVTVVRALGRIGDPAAIEPLVRELDAPYSTVMVYVFRPAIDAALRSITGERGIVGKEEWKAWWKAKQSS